MSPEGNCAARWHRNVTLLDITGVARTLVAHTYAPYEIFLVAGALYLVLVLATTRVLAAVERWLTVEAAAAPAPRDLAQPIG
jgi:octopine/nopaline transport system permease protein